MYAIPFFGMFLGPFILIIPIALSILSMYVLILLIKALKIYINKNS